MDREKPHDESQVPEGVEKFQDERLDSFMGYEERSKVWDLLAHDLGSQWTAMDRQERERIVKRFTDNIIKEVITMAGGIWENLSPQQQRELFRARFTDTTVVPVERQDAFEELKKESDPDPRKRETEESFPDMDNWFLKNRNLMFGMMRTEREAAYRSARGKWEKEQKK